MKYSSTNIKTSFLHLKTSKTIFEKRKKHFVQQFRKLFTIARKLMTSCQLEIKRNFENRS